MPAPSPPPFVATHGRGSGGPHGDGGETTAAARAEHLTKIYGEGATQVIALDDVTVDFPQGQFTAIMGRPGPASPP